MGIILNRRRVMGGSNDIDWSEKYLTFEALESGTFQFTNACEYSIDEGAWTSLTASTNTPTLTAGSKIRWRATITPTSSTGVGTFSSTCRYNAMGNPLSLILGEYFTTTQWNGANYAHYRLFYNNINLVDAINLRPVNIYKNGNYHEMFRGCINLLSIPSLVINVSYANIANSMFYGCTSLEDVSMVSFEGNPGYNSLVSIFQNCTSIIKAMPILPATDASSVGAYYNMFDGCSSLKVAPSISASKVGNSSFYNMFKNCTSLITPPPILPAETLATACYIDMFLNCKSLESAPVLPASNLTTNCYYEMFKGCEKLKHIKCLATDISASNCLYDWLNGVSANGTFVKHPDMASWTTGTNGIPSGWTVEDAVVE